MKNFKSEQSGRSMIEMLAVLAIIGILSVAGIAGYSKAMGKYKEQKLADQITTLTSNIRTLYANQASYNGLTNTTAVSYNAVPLDMVTATAGTLTNASGGTTVIAVATVNAIADAGFSVTMTGINKNACMYLATSDWGSGQVGLVSTAFSPTATVGTAITGGTPQTLADAETLCNCASSVCSAQWIYI